MDPVHAALFTEFVAKSKFGTERHGQRDPNSYPWAVEHMHACLDAFDGAGPIVVLANREPPSGTIVRPMGALW
jgi:hypothetical protein